MDPWSSLLAQEQSAFCRRARSAWEPHLHHTRTFLEQGLAQPRPPGPALILGAGAGLEVPWHKAPRSTEGWDADPWSRVRTFLRHGRWPQWHFEDLTGALAPLHHLLQRTIRRDWRGHLLGRHEVTVARLTGLLPTLPVQPECLRTTLETMRPSLILEANVMGQFGAVARRMVERAFGAPPWEQDPDVQDPLSDALDAWTHRVIQTFAHTLGQSGAALWMVHDLAVFVGDGIPLLGPFQPDWRQQIQCVQWLEAFEPLCGARVPELLARTPLIEERWLWPIAPGQIHLMEALAFAPTVA